MKAYSYKIFASLVSLSIAAGLTASCSVASTVQVATKPTSAWKSFPSRTLNDLPASVTRDVDTQLSQYGGITTHKAPATGFFHTQKINGRWWLVDPEGCLYINKGLAHVAPDTSRAGEALLQEKFGSETNWAEQTTSWLHETGFNGAGGWSDYEKIRAVKQPVVYTRMLSFMSGYGHQRGGTFSQPGHTGYPNDCIFVFDPAFETFCNEYAKQLLTTKDDPWMLGCFSDNEMPLHREALSNYLRLPDSDAGHQAAEAWLKARKGKSASINQITPQDEKDFLVVVVARYFEIVSRAVKKADPNHLYLGSRFYGKSLRFDEIFKAAGPYVDVVSVNYYNAWTPERERLELWARLADKPILITEWYAKGMDSNMPNVGGAGWVVKTQHDRGLFYENFTLGLMESKVCVGWHWFKYMDNDPKDKKVEAAGYDSNKGAFNSRYVPYIPLIDSMRRLNQHAYSIIDYFDSVGKSNAKAAAKPVTPVAENK